MVVHGGGWRSKEDEAEVWNRWSSFQLHITWLCLFQKIGHQFQLPRVGPHTSDWSQSTMSPSCHHLKVNLSFFLVYTNIYLPIDRACATTVTVVPNRRNDIEGQRRRLKKRAGEVEKTGEKAGRHEMGAQALKLKMHVSRIFSFSYICTNHDVFANEKICP